MASAAGGGGAPSTSSAPLNSAPQPPPLPNHSPPKAEVDDSPLQNAMDRNKESLKVKLMLRRPINQLVAQGIMPPLKTPPAFHEQRQKLERAKMGDLLKAKIQQRPDRQELVRQHILEDVGHVDPSLAERQRMLKKCRLADQLNDQLSHRPGPLELIKKNILHTDEPIERAVKEGHIEFKATSEGQKTKPQPPDHYMTMDDDSQSSEATSPRDLASLASPPEQQPTELITDSPIDSNQLTASASAETAQLIGSRDVIETAAAQAGIVTVLVPSTLLATAPSPSLSLSSSLSPLSSISSPPSARPAPPPGKDKNRKKSKTKTQPKARTIKFHEYKGPPNAHKTSPPSASPGETSYELLLQQQQLFLQWQLEWQHTYPQIILPASQKPPEPAPSLIAVTKTAPPAPPLPQPTTVQPPPPPPPPDTRPLRNLEDMKVSDLRMELKKRNLPVSGPKPQLIERLKPFSESSSSLSMAVAADDSSLLSVCHVSPPQSDSYVSDSSPPPPLPASPSPLDPSSPLSPPAPASPSPSHASMETEASEEIIREQRRKIDELQRQLLRSQMQLQQQQHHHQQNTFQPQQQLNAKANLAAFLQQQQLNQLLLQQQQHQQAQQQAQQQQQQTQTQQQQTTQHIPQLQLTLTTTTAGNNNNNNNNNNLVINNNNNNNNANNNNKQQRVMLGQQQAALVLNQINLKTNGHNRTATLPNFLGTFVGNTPVVLSTEQVPELLSQTEMLDEKPPPPLYEDATKLLKVKMEPDETIRDVKSQIVDDVLEILIKNGELPASAAQDLAPSPAPLAPPPQAPPTAHLDLRELGLDVELLDSVEESMELGVNENALELMDVDTEWLDSLMDGPHPSNGSGGPSTSAGHDPLLNQDPFDLFAMDDSEFKMSPDFGWDRVGDFTA